jgi:hypothetical protein
MRKKSLSDDDKKLSDKVILGGLISNLTIWYDIIFEKLEITGGYWAFTQVKMLVSFWNWCLLLKIVYLVVSYCSQNYEDVPQCIIITAGLTSDFIRSDIKAPEIEWLYWALPTPAAIMMRHMGYQI